MCKWRSEFFTKMVLVIFGMVSSRQFLLHICFPVVITVCSLYTTPMVHSDLLAKFHIWLSRSKDGLTVQSCQCQKSNLWKSLSRKLTDSTIIKYDMVTSQLTLTNENLHLNKTTTSELNNIFFSELIFTNKNLYRRKCHVWKSLISPE